MTGGRISDRLIDSATFFYGGRLTLGRQLAGLRKSELAQRLGKSATAVAAWETGAKHPASATVAELALCLAVDPGFFAVRPSDVASLSTTPHFRSLRSTSQLARDQAYAYGQLAVDIACALERHVELPDRDLPSFLVTEDNPSDDRPEQAARQVREAWRLGADPVRHVVRLLENHGVLVVFSPDVAASVDAYSFDSRVRPVVVLNPVKQDYYRQRFDVAHELGHLVMHADAEPGSRLVEDQAHRFAAEFLAPAAELYESLPTSMNRQAWVTLRQLKEQWGISIQALLYRARSLGRLSDVSYRNAMATISTRGWRRDEPGLINHVEQPSLLSKAVELLVREGIPEEALVDQCRVPAALFHAAVSRVPLLTADRTEGPGSEDHAPSRVVSLLEWRHSIVRKDAALR